MAANQLLQTRIDGAIKEEAAAVLAAMGLTVSDAVRLMLTRVAREHALQFDPLLPNATTVAAMKEARAGNPPRLLRLRSALPYRTSRHRSFALAGGSIPSNQPLGATQTPPSPRSKLMMKWRRLEPFARLVCFGSVTWSSGRERPSFSEDGRAVERLASISRAS